MPGGEELELIREVSLAAARARDPQRVLALTLEIACDHLEAVAGTVWLRADGGGWEVAHSYAPANPPPVEEFAPDSLPPVVSAMLRTSAPSATWALGSVTDPLSVALRDAGASTATAVVLGGSEPAGVLLVAVPRAESLAGSGRPFLESLGSALAPVFIGRDRARRSPDGGSLEADLRWAVEQGELSVAYQPVVDLSTGRLSGVEALARWNRPGVGPVSPEEFIPAAEETGLIRMLGANVLLVACRQVAEWQATHPVAENLTLAVNISASQLDHPDLLDTVDEALARSGLAPRHLVLEITETVASRDIPGSTQRLHELRQRDIHIAVDDFGTGYSSLGRLRDLPVDILKIDRSFLADVVPADGDPPVLAALVAVGRTLGLRVIAEGVETSEQLAAVVNEGCDEAQGFLLSRPLPPADAERLLEDPTWDATGIATPAEVQEPTPRDELRLLLQEIGSGRRDGGEALAAVLEEVTAATGLESTYVTRVNDDRTAQTIVTAHDAGTVTVPVGLTLPWSGGLPRDGISADPWQHPDAAQRRAAQEMGAGTLMEVPVTDTSGEVVGTLCGVAGDRRELGEDTRATLEAVARVIGEAVRSAPLNP